MLGTNFVGLADVNQKLKIILQKLAFFKNPTLKRLVHYVRLFYGEFGRMMTFSLIDGVDILGVI